MLLQLTLTPIFMRDPMSSVPAYNVVGVVSFSLGSTAEHRRHHHGAPHGTPCCVDPQSLSNSRMLLQNCSSVASWSQLGKHSKVMYHSGSPKCRPQLDGVLDVSLLVAHLLQHLLSEGPGFSI